MGILIFVSLLFASEKPVELIGHNLTPSIYTLQENQVTLGNYTFAYGVTDHVMLATSPWLYANYNMNSVLLRTRMEINETEQWGVQLAYFKTQRIFPNIFEMEAYGLWLTRQNRIQDNYSLTYGVNVLHFLNDNIPFSLRRASFDSSKTQISLISLHEFLVSSSYGILAEVAVIGPNFVYPNLHWGVSFHYRNNWFLGQIGLSTSGFLSRLGQQNVSINFNAGHGQTVQMEYDEYYKNAVVPHPEIQIQFYY
jgi:hypothetical protein